METATPEGVAVSNLAVRRPPGFYRVELELSGRAARRQLDASAKDAYGVRAHSRHPLAPPIAVSVIVINVIKRFVLIRALGPRIFVYFNELSFLLPMQEWG